MFIVGAGATYNEGLEENIEKSKRSPLDKQFFSKYETEPDKHASLIEQYLNETYGINLYDDEYNSLEKIMVILYADIFRSSHAFLLFQNLVMLLNKRLADSTNKLNSNPESPFYKMVDFFISEYNYKPDKVTFITFNQDIQIEKLIDKLGRDEKRNIKTDLLNFPYYYQLSLPDKFESIKVNLDGENEFFEKGLQEKAGVNILKLHGSLNWYGFLNKMPSKTITSLFNKNRRMRIYSDKILYNNIKYTEEGSVREYPSFPIIVPPVTNKFNLFHKNMNNIWKKAEEKLKTADQIIIFGYSFPTSDFESAYLFKRALKGRNDIQLSIIDPDPSVIQKFVNITEINEINWYKSPSEFINHI